MDRPKTIKYKPSRKEINSYNDYIIEDNKLKHNKFVPGVKIPIKNKHEIKSKNNKIVVLAWNFFQEIKKSNPALSDSFINIKDLEWYLITYKEIQNNIFYISNRFK